MILCVYNIIHKQRSREGEDLCVSLPVAEMCKTFANILDEDGDCENDDALVCPKFSGDILKTVIKYCEYYQNVEEMAPIETPFPPGATLEDIVKQEWYVKFISYPDIDTLRTLIAAAHFLDIEPLVDLGSLRWGYIIAGKTEEEQRVIFKLPSPLR